MGDLVKNVAKKTKLPQKDVRETLTAAIDAIRGELRSGRPVRLIGFGTFEIRHRKARQGRNPQTGKVVQIKARKVAAFRPGRPLREAVNR